MNNMLHIASGINVLPILLELKNNPQLWNEHIYRTKNSASPHYELDDLWLRYNHTDNMPCDVAAPHESVWYPAADKLPSLKKMAYDIMHMVNGERLGGILLTRIPPGKQCKPHKDIGTWHAEYYDKYALQLESHPSQAFHFQEGSFAAKPGDLYWFFNQEEHWVTNDSDVDRITCIFCIRTNKGDRFNIPSLNKKEQ